MQAERDRARQRLVARLRPPLVFEHAAPRVQADAHAVRALELKAVIALRLDAGFRVARDEHAGGEITARVAGEVRRNRQAAQVEVGACQHALAKRRTRDDIGLDRVLDASRILQREPRLRHAERPRQRAATGHHVGDDRHVRAGNVLEDQHGPAAPPLVFEDQRHDVVLERHGLGDANDLGRKGLLVRSHEVAHALSGHGLSAPRGSRRSARARPPSPRSCRRARRTPRGGGAGRRGW